MATSIRVLSGAPRALIKDDATGSGAIAHSYTVQQSGFLNYVSVHFSAAPITSENLVVTLDQLQGAAYDIELSSTDPSSAGDLFYLPSEPIYLEEGDIISVTFTNTDGRTYGSIITFVEMG